jgi:multiple sugar transport system substrate-binding protein
MSVTRRQALLLGAGTAGAAAVGLAGCTPGAHRAQRSEGTGDRELVFLSTQLRPVEEAEKLRHRILAGYDGKVSFIGSDIDPFIDRISSEVRTGKGSIGLIGCQHGDLASLAAGGMLLGLGQLAGELRGRNFNPEYLELAHFGGDEPRYIPWIQATYIMAARKEAVPLLPAGASLEALTYDQLLQWARRINRDQGGKKLGFPAAQEGLLRRFFQGYVYPSFTGALNTRFKSADAVTMWEWMRRAWTESNRQSPAYAFMQEPLQSGEVWVAWDHVARLIKALKANPADFVAFPAPTGPKGLGYLPALAGLAVPKTSPDPEGAKRLIRYLTLPSTAAVTLREVGFFAPTTLFDLPTDLNAGIRAEAEAVQAQSTNPRALASLVPVGLQDKSGAYDDVFRTTFEAIVLQDQPVRATLDAKGRQLQAVLDAVRARCWRPDPPSSGTCQVGG